MPRVARVVVPGMPHHVTQRGNRRQETFFGQDDYQAYLALMREWCGRQGLRVWAYCLMPNHVHLIVVPPSEQALCRGIGETHRRLARRVNFREGWRGHLWQGRFGSFVMDEPYLIRAARYIERNPVRARLVARAEDWPYSSAAAHAAGRDTGKSGLLAESAWLAERTAGWVCSWGDFLRGDDAPELAAALRRREATGRPLGDGPFVTKIKRLLGRDLLPGKPGPAPKQGKKKQR